MDAHQIIPHLYLGSRDYTIEDLYKLNIDVAICMAPEDQVDTITDDKIKFIRYPVSFQQSDIISKKNMLEAIDMCNSCINEKQNVYLHCVAGYNRSAAVAVLVVKHQLNISRNDAIKFIDKIHPIQPTKHLAIVDAIDKEVSSPTINTGMVPIYYSICRSWSDGEEHDPEEENSMYNFSYFKIYEDNVTKIICSDNDIIMECNNKDELEYDEIVSFISIKKAKDHVRKGMSYIYDTHLMKNINIKKHALNFIKNNTDSP